MSSIKERSFVSLLRWGMAVAVVCHVGCQGGDRPPLGRVSGVVTLDGEPLAGMEISFTPQSGRPSLGVTDAAGRYELTYVGATKGAKVGRHRVTIAAPLPDLDDEKQPSGGGRPASLPPRYNTQTELTADVKGGSNTLDFSLESK